MNHTLNYAQMVILCRELQQRVAGFKVVNCLPNNPKRFFLILRHETHQENLFFCFEPPFLRFHLSNTTPLPKDNSSHPLLAFLQGAILREACLLQDDRILQLSFETSAGEKLFIAEFFSKHPNYYLLNPDHSILFALHSLNHSHYQLPTRPLSKQTEPPRWSNHQETEQAYQEYEQKWEFERDKRALHANLNKQFKKLEKKEQELVQTLERCTQWAKIQHEGELIKAHLSSFKKGYSSIAVQDWTTGHDYHLILDPSKTPQEEMITRFRRAKKLQLGLEPLTQQLKQTRDHLQQIKQQQQQLDLLVTKQEIAASKAKQILVPRQTQKAASAISPPTIYREYLSKKGLKIWVGKNAKANDQLTFHLARGRDWWLHVKGCPGSHVIIRIGKDPEPDSETIEDALQLALLYSKAKKQGEGEVCITQRKYVARMGKGGQAGQVQISKHRTVWVRFDQTRYDALKVR